MTKLLKIKYLLVTCVVICAFEIASAQQFPHYSLFVYNKMGYNPGYTGVPDAACIQLSHRSQWIGLDGAPQTQMLSANLPFLKKKLGLGMMLTNHKIGVTRIVSADLNYAYHMNIGKGQLSAGLQGTVRYYAEDYNDNRIQATQGTGLDGSIPLGLQNRYLPNVGFGLHYSTDKYYIGASAMRLIPNNIDFGNSDVFVSAEVPHFFGMAGYSLILNDQVKLQPQVLLKYVKNAPFDLEFFLGLELLERYMIALNYRAGGEISTGAGDSIDLIFGLQMTDKLLFAVAYDITLTKIRKYNNGSVEAMLQYCVGGSAGKNIINPRFF